MSKNTSKAPRGGNSLTSSIVIFTLMMGLFFAVPAFAHEPGVVQPHDGNILHPAYGVDHMLIVLAAVAVAALVIWRSR